MAPADIAVKRGKWRDAFDASRPLSEMLDSPFVPMWQVAIVMGVSDATAYDSAKRYDAAMRAGDRKAAAREVPCVLLGHSHRVPHAAFIRWWETAGGVTLQRLTEVAS